MKEEKKQEKGKEEGSKDESADINIEISGDSRESNDTSVGVNNLINPHSKGDDEIPYF